tara:strand:- start:58 stop:279 length:222 start_codon:yes stop_codon:yes gene_type:complete
MKVLKELPAPTRSRSEKYPWTEWFDGTPRLLEEGIDYLSTTEGFRSCAYAAARRHAIKILVRTLPEGIAIQAR